MGVLEEEDKKWIEHFHRAAQLPLDIMFGDTDMEPNTPVVHNTTLNEILFGDIEIMENDTYED